MASRRAGPQMRYWQTNNPYAGQVGWRPWGGSTTQNEWLSMLTGTAVDSEGNPMVMDEATQAQIWQDAVGMVANQMLYGGFLSPQRAFDWGGYVGEVTGQNFDVNETQLPVFNNNVQAQREWQSANYWNDVLESINRFYNQNNLVGDAGAPGNAWADARDWGTGVAETFRDFYSDGWDPNNKYNQMELRNLWTNLEQSAKTHGINEDFVNLFYDLAHPGISAPPSWGWADSGAFSRRAPRYGGGTYYASPNQRYQ